jgi:hypothetical protein
MSSASLTSKTYFFLIEIFFLVFLIILGTPGFFSKMDFREKVEVIVSAIEIFV